SATCPNSRQFATKKWRCCRSRELPSHRQRLPQARLQRRLLRLRVQSSNEALHNIHPSQIDCCSRCLNIPSLDISKISSPQVTYGVMMSPPKREMVLRTVFWR